MKESDKRDAAAEPKESMFMQIALTYAWVPATSPSVSPGPFAAAACANTSHPHPCIHACRYIVLWIGLSAAVILINKYVLAYSGFPFPIALTLTHMAFCASLAFLLVKLGVSDTAHMDSNTYIK